MRQESIGDDLLPAPLNAVVPRSDQARAALFWRPQYVRNSALLWHVPFLFWVMEIARPRHYVEIGVGDGVAYMAACQSLHRLQTEAECHAVGVWKDKEVPAQLASRNADLYGHFSRILTDGVERSHRHFAAGTIDLVLVDLAAIAEAGVPASVIVEALREKWLPKLSEQGILLVHGAEEEESVLAFIDELSARVPAIRLAGGDGIIALLYGTQPVERLANIAALPVEHQIRQALVQMFERLGAASYYEVSGRTSEERAQSADRHLQELQKEYDGLAVRLEESLARYEGRHRQVATLQAKSFDLEMAKDAQRTEIERLRQELNALREARDELARQREAEGTAHQAAQSQAAEFKVSAEQRQAEIERLRQELNALREARDELARQREAEGTAHQAAQSQAAEFKVSAEQRQAEIERLRQELNAWREERDELVRLQHRDEAARVEWGQERNALTGEVADLKLSGERRETEIVRLSQVIDRMRQEGQEWAERWEAQREVHARVQEDHRAVLEDVARLEREASDHRQANAAVQSALKEAVEARDHLEASLEEELELHLQGTRVLTEALERNEGIVQALVTELRQTQAQLEIARSEQERETGAGQQASAALRLALEEAVKARDALEDSSREEFALHLQGAKMLTQALEQNESIVEALTLELRHVQNQLAVAQENEKDASARYETELDRQRQANTVLEATLQDARKARDGLEAASREQLALHSQTIKALTETLEQNESVAQALATELRHAQEQLVTARENEAALMEITLQNQRVSPLQRFTAWAGSMAQGDRE